VKNTIQRIDELKQRYYLYSHDSVEYSVRFEGQNKYSLAQAVRNARLATPIMSRQNHKSNPKFLKNVDVVSHSPSSSTSPHESHELIYPLTNQSPKKKKNKMAAFIDTFYNSFSSAQSQEKPDQYTVYAEMQLLKVTAPKYDLEKFTNESFRIKQNVGIGVEVKVILPSRKNEQRLKRLEEREKENHDFLDYIFSDTIPFFHDFLIYGSPDVQFFQIKGKKGDIDIFNKLCRQMIFSKELQCKLEVTDRREIPLNNQFNNSIFGGPNSEPDVLDAIFTEDLSSCNPFLHNLLLSVY